MGNCPSSFRAQFSPNQNGTESGTTDIILTPEKPPLPPDAEEPTKKNSSDGVAQDRVSAGEKTLTVQNVDLCISENAIDHFTNDFDIVQKNNPRLVVRRGFPFTVKLTLSREANLEKDVICFVFTAKDCHSPSYAQGTLILVPVIPTVCESVLSDAWQAKLLSREGNTITAQVTTSSRAIVGEWIMEVDTKFIEKPEEKSIAYTVKDPFYLLFNPWCKQDAVYMDDIEGREEYVLNQSGLIWRGNHSTPRPCIWSFAQFEEDVLPCCFYLLTHLGRLNAVGRADPVRVVRHLSAIMNPVDQSGVLISNYTGDYKGGQSCTTWTGSHSILQKFYKTKKPVKFGQCWVNSGVFTTVCRTLGIPARSVTAFSSAHDTHHSLTVDLFYDNEGKPVNNLNVDSIWNFHVWNETWMERPDLEPGVYGGWQAVDPTLQQECDGVYRCGPASVTAIKRGEVRKAYDTPFIDAEVNSSKVTWRYFGPYKALKLVDNCKEETGRAISTKAKSAYEREDITHEYKVAKDHQVGHEVMLHALREHKNSFSRYYVNNAAKDVTFAFSLLENVTIGLPFSVKLKATNKSPDDKEYTIRVVLRIDSMLYTGQLRKLIKKDDFEIKLAGGVDQDMTMTVNYVEYEKFLTEHCAFSVTAMAHVIETDYDYIAQDTFHLSLPEIVVETDGDIVQGQPFTVTAHFTNPLPKGLRNGIFTLEGPGLGKPLTLKVKGNVRSGGEARISGKMTARTVGQRAIIAKFRSKELEDVEGYCVINVKSPADTMDKDMNSHL